MSYVDLQETPLRPDGGPARIFYRQAGSGPPLIYLHGGWGYDIYPFESQIAAFSDRFTILIPDRTGYGGSPRFETFPSDFHHRAAGETFAFIDALKLERPILWGHSDGAVIAVLMALAQPERLAGLILEAFHLYRVKPASRGFFEAMAENPERLGEGVTRVLAREHGEEYWPRLIRSHGRAWLQIADESPHEKADLYNGRLGQLRVPAVFIHGSRDPRTEPDELDAVRRQLPNVPLHVIEGGGHTPHAEEAVQAECNRYANEFLVSISGNG